MMAQAKASKTAASIIAEHRIEKAQALLQVFLDHQYSLGLVELMSDHDWHIAACAAGVKPPSPETKRLVKFFLEQWEGTAKVH